MTDVVQDTGPTDRAHGSPGDGMTGAGPADDVGTDRRAASTPGACPVGPQLVAGGTALATGIVLWPFNCDDAAISFRFADQFADGAPLGTLVRGEALVSGFSNPLWTLVLATAHRIGLPITGTAKVLGLLAAIATAVLVVRIVALLGGGRVARWTAAAVGLSVTTAIWAVSGMENASVGLLVVATAHLLVAAEVRSSRRHLAGAAVTVALLAVSRPDAFVYVGAGALAALLARRRSSPESRLVLPTALWLAPPLALLAAWTWFSTSRFGHPLPNTYYAKVDTTLADRLLDPIGSMRQPLRGAWVFAVNTAAVALVPQALVGIGRRWRGAGSTPLLLLLAAMALPLSERDWMVDHRFFTAALPLLFVFASLGAETLWIRGRRSPSTGTRLLGVLAVGLVAAWGVANVRLTLDRRISGFEGQVTTELIADQAEALEAVAERHGIADPLVMTADAGATLFDHELRLVDLAGLVDPQIGQLMDDADRRAEYGFTERRPDVVRASTRAWAAHRRWGLDDAALRRAGYLATDAVDDVVYVRRDRVVRHATSPGDALRSDGLEVPEAVDGGTITVRAWVTGLDRAEGDEIGFRLTRSTGETTRATNPLGDLLDPGPGWRSDEAVLHVARLQPPGGSGPLTLTVTAGADRTTVLERVTIEEGRGAVARAAEELTADLTSPEDAVARLGAALDLAAAAPGNRDVTAAIDEVRASGRDLVIRPLLRVANDEASDPEAEQAVETARRHVATLRGRRDPSPAEADASRRIRRRAAAAASAEDRYRWLVVAWALDPRSADIQAELLAARDARPPIDPLHPDR